MPRVVDISSLGPWKGKRVSLRAPKSAAHKAPDYVVLHEPQKKTVSRGGKIVQVPEAAKTIYAEPTAFGLKNICSMGKGKAQLRGCHVELIFLGSKYAPQAGVKPGAYLRLCQSVGQKDAPLIRVNDHREAQRISKAYCECKKGGSSGETCVRTAQAKTGHVMRGLAGLRGRIRRN